MRTLIQHSAMALTDFDHPPPSWRRSIKDDAKRVRLWMGVSIAMRRHVWNAVKAAEKRESMMKARVALDPSDERARNFLVKRDRMMSRFDHTAEDRIKQRYQAIRLNAHRESHKVLRFQREHIKGCSVVGCVLAPNDKEPLLSLFEHDHLTRDGKRDSVTRLFGSARVLEQKKTQVLCLWHHVLKTREEHGTVVEAKHRKNIFYRRLGEYKMKVGCQHPLHDSMPYAGMASKTSDDPRFVGFLHVSHITRAPKGRRKDSYKSRMNDIQSGLAVVHCAMCHRLYTACEMAKLYDTPVAQFNFKRLSEEAPDFVRHFEDATSGYDWVAARAHIKRKFELVYARRRTPKWDEGAYIAAQRHRSDAKGRMAKMRRVSAPVNLRFQVDAMVPG